MVNKFQQGGQPQSLEQLVVLLVQAAMLGDAQALKQILLIVQAAKQGDQQAMLIAQLIQATMQQMLQSARQGAKLNYLKKINGICPEGTQPTYYKVGGLICTKCEAMADGGKAKKTIDVPKKRPIEPNDTVHVAGKPYNITNSDGTPRNPHSKYPDYSAQQYQKDRKSKDPDERRRAEKLDMNTEKKGGTITEKACPKCGKVHAGKCGSKLMKKKKKCACGTKIDPKKGACGTKLKKTKKHEIGGVLEVMQKLQNGGSLKRIPF